MEQLHKYSWSLQRTPEGPLVPYIQAFIRLLSTQGYAATSAQLYTRLVADFSRWLKKRNITEEVIALDHVERYLRYRATKRRPRIGDAAALRQLLVLLRKERVIAPQTVSTDATPVQHLLDEYALYLRRERILL